MIAESLCSLTENNNLLWTSAYRFRFMFGSVSLIFFSLFSRSPKTKIDTRIVSLWNDAHVFIGSVYLFMFLLLFSWVNIWLLRFFAAAAASSIRLPLYIYRHQSNSRKLTLGQLWQLYFFLFLLMILLLCTFRPFPSVCLLLLIKSKWR